MAGEARVLARVLVSSGALRIGEFVLSSGARSRVYVDLRSVPARPEGFRLVASMLAGAAASVAGDFDSVVGVATGGVPWASVVAFILGKPMGYVRPERKGHGTGRRVEGACSGRVLLVDDVATTGGSLASAAEAVRAEGGEPRYALVVVDREMGAAERLASMGVTLLRLATLREVLEAAVEEGLLGGEALSVL